MSTFESRKHQVVSSLVETLDAERRDKSPKGFIDAPILNLIHIINRHCDYYTTSSCSGRIAIYCEGLEEQEGLEKTTKGGKWLYVSHDPVEIPSDADDEWIKKLLFGSEYHRLCNPTAAAPGDAEDIMKQQLIFFKFEPLILHVEAASLEACMHLNSLAFQAGYQNSGITPSRTRHMLAIRSTHKLDTPIAYVDHASDKIVLLVDPTYLFLLLRMSNEKFAQNSDRMKAFEQVMEKQVLASQSRPAVETKEERRERKRREGLARQQQQQLLQQQQQRQKIQQEGNEITIRKDKEQEEEQQDEHLLEDLDLE